MQRKEPVTLYFKDGYGLEALNSFLYEMTIYKYSKNLVEMIYTKLVRSDKPIKFRDVIVEKRPKKDKRGYFYTKEVEWLGAPLSYLLENNFKKVTYVPNDRTSKRRDSKKDAVSSGGRATSKRKRS